MEIDCIVVGKGIAGSWLCWYLWQQKKSFVIFDSHINENASHKAAGIINSHTGKRYTAWDIHNEIIPFAISEYQQAETFFLKKFIEQKPMLHFFETKEEELFFEKRIRENNSNLSFYNHHNKGMKDINFSQKIGQVESCFQVNNSLFLQTIQEKLIAENQYIAEDFEEELLQVTENKIMYKNIHAKKIIYSNGVNTMHSKFWKHIHFANTKGEFLIAEIKQLNPNFIYKNKLTIAPFDKNLWWIGASNQWQYENEKPSKEFKENTIQWLQTFLRKQVTILEHKSAIRPTSLNRKPICEIHPSYKNMLLINGMGTKGYTMATYYGKKIITDFC